METIANIDGSILVSETKNTEFYGEKFDVRIQFNLNGSFTITRETDNESWIGNYTIKESTVDSVLLEMTFEDGTSAQAVYGDRKIMCHN